MKIAKIKFKINVEIVMECVAPKKWRLLVEIVMEIVKRKFNAVIVMEIAVLKKL